MIAGSTFPFVRLLCAAAAAASISTPSAAGESQEDAAGPGGLVEEEDRVDRLPPEQQVKHYEAIRASLQSRDDPWSQAALGRLTEKLALARLMVAHPHANFAMRLSFCKKAAAIGDDYLRRGEVRRALFWAERCRRIEPRNEYASVLRNRVNDHLRSLLDVALGACDWDGARAVLARWRKLVGDEAAADRGGQAYAQARARSLINQLASGDTVAVVSALVAEETRLPGADPWKDVRSAVRAYLQGPFDRAVADRRIPDARAALETQREVLGQLGPERVELPLDDNARRLEELVEALAPSPLERPYGPVRGVSFRLEAGSFGGDFEFDSRDVRIARDGRAPFVAVTYRTRAERRSFFGGGIDYAQIETSEGVSSNSATLVHFDVLAGVRGGRWSAWALLGAVHGSFRFAGTASTDEGGGLAFGGVGAGLEYAISHALSGFLDARLIASERLEHVRGRVGVRYYANANFGLDVHLHGAQMQASDEDSGARITGRYLTAGIAAIVQF
jgi:hypothetical protein